MNPFTQILNAIEQDDPKAAEQLLPLVYEELRQLAAQRLAQEKPGQTLQATALVHEAYLRLVGHDSSQPWNSRGHFFAAAAEAMRRILVEQARRRKSLKGGGQHQRLSLEVAASLAEPPHSEDLLALDEALELFARHAPEAAQLVKLRFFAGLAHQEAAESMGISRGMADRHWALARAWLFRQLNPE